MRFNANSTTCSLLQAYINTNYEVHCQVLTPDGGYGEDINVESKQLTSFKGHGHHSTDRTTQNAMWVTFGYIDLENFTSLNSGM